MQKPQELIPAVVQEYDTGRVLTLAYVNRESLEEMEKTGETHFWSRSRNRLWHKGETSGNVQKVRRTAYDCDRDALLIQVNQRGTGACHTGQYSCFGDEGAPFDILNQIHAQIRNRKDHPREGSYTNYLLNQGIDKIAKKVMEEAAETIIAAKNGDGPGLIEEIADLAYHVLVLMFDRGLTPGDIREKLAERHRVEGNLKAKNEKGAY